MDADWNPFRVVESEHGPAYANEDSPELKVEAHTVICVTDDADGTPPINGEVKLEFAGLWWPKKGDALLLRDPQRTAVVVGVQAEVEPRGFTAYVYVKDPERI